MADLLECLVQIRALRESPGRAARLLEATEEEAWARRPGPEVWAPLEVLAHLADKERFYGTRIHLILCSDRPVLEAFDEKRFAERGGYLRWHPKLALERFRNRRLETLGILDGCSAEQLARVGEHRRRGPITVADQVALMLAHDTHHLGQIHERLGRGPDTE